MRSAGRSLAAHAPGRSHDDHAREDGHDAPESAAAAPPVASAHSSGTKDETRSSYGTVPGAELPAFVYITVVAAFGWIMLASWVAFSGNTDAALALGMGTVLATMFFGLPIIIHHEAVSFSHPKPQAARDFLAAPVETATGPVTGASAWLQVLIIPLSLALAAALIGTAFMLVR